jgi:hypothetical protein
MQITSSTQYLDRSQISLANVSGESAPTPPHPVLRASLKAIGVGFHQATDRQLRIKLGEAELAAVDVAARALIDAAEVWKQTIASIPPNSSSSPSDHFAVTLLYRIIETAKESGITSSSPSFVYASGYELHAQDQRSIRRDPGWLMLARLRHWLRQSDLPSTGEGLSAGEFSMRVVSEMARLEDAFCGDESLVLSQPFVKKILAASPGLQTPSEAVKPARATSVFVNVGHLAVRHHGKMLERTAIATSSFEILGGSAAMQKSTFSKNSTEVDHLRLAVAVKDVRSEVHDSVLPAIETLLTLGRKDNAPTSPPDLADKSSSPHLNGDLVAPAMLIVLDVHLKQAQLAVLAGGLRLGLNIAGLENAIARRSGSSSDGKAARPIKQDSVFLCCESVNIVLAQIQEDDTARVVASFVVDGVRTTVDSRLVGYNNDPMVCRVLLGIDSVDFDSRPQLRAFLAFARDWQKAHLQ